MQEPERDATTNLPINPINPVTVNQLTIDELEGLLTQQRDTRLTYVRKLEALSKVKVEAHQAGVQFKFEKQVERVRAALMKFEELESKIREGINKLRVMQVEFEQ